jgi:hypothetical protein
MSVCRSLGFAAAVGVTLLASSIVAGPAMAQPQRPTCTVVGTSGDDLLRGTARADVICGRGGEDTIFGKGGADLLLGGAGDDELHGDRSRDDLAGGPGTDVLDGGAGTNKCAQRRVARRSGVCVGYVTIRRFSLSDEKVRGNGRIKVRLSVTDSRPEPPAIELIYVFTEHLRSEAGSRAGALFLTHGTPAHGRWEGDLLVREDFPRGLHGVGLETIQNARTGPGETVDIVEPRQLDVAGFANRFRKVGKPDNKPPVLKQITITPEQVDTSQATQMIMLRFRVVDDTEVRTMLLNLVGPRPGSTVSTPVLMPERRESGDQRDGVYAVPFYLPRYAARGAWRITSVTLFDNESLSSHYDKRDLKRLRLKTRFEQIGPGDDVPPVLREFTASPERIDTTDGGNDFVDLRAVMTDDLIGVRSWRVSLVNQAAPESSRDFLQFFQSPTEIEHETRVYLTGVADPDPSPPAQGTYEITIEVTDAAGNVATYSSADLAANGFSSSIYNGP